MSRRRIQDPAQASGLRQLTLWFDGFTAAAPEEVLRHANRLLTTVLVLMAFGFLVQASHAATTLSPEQFRSDLIGEIGIRAIGLGVLFGAWWLGPTRLRPFLAPLVVLVLLMLAAVWAPGIGRSINGAARWIHVGLSIQPSELARIVLVLWIADRCVRAGPRLSSFTTGALPMLGMVALFASLVALQPDIGATLLLVLGALATMWVGGVAFRKAAIPVLVFVAVGLAAAARFLPHVRGRFAMWRGASHNEQVADSIAALSNAGPTGVGFAAGELRNRGFNYMDSDFVFALVGEEFGLAGVLFVLALIAAFLWHTLRLVLAMPGRFEAVAAFGLCLSVAFQVLVHVQVATGMVPPKGMTFPFLSAGGTSFVVSSLAIGLALGAARATAAPRTAVVPASQSA
jgi:cell division protein FtsW